MDYRIFDIQRNIVFKCDDPGLEQSISDKLNLMCDSHMLSSVVVDSDDVHDAAATFSYGNQVGNFGIPRIDLSKGKFTYNDTTHILRPDTIESALFLQHELNHFVHIDYDNGKYIHPNLVKYGKYDSAHYFKTGIASTSKDVIKINEIECAWRCLLDDIKYGVSKENAFLDRTLQLKNIMHYLNLFHLNIQIKYYNKLTDESKKRLIEDCIPQIELSKLDKHYQPKFSFHWTSYKFI